MINDIVISRNGKSKGRMTGGVRICQLAGCTGICYAVRWTDGKLSYPCSKGLTQVTGNKFKIH